MIVIANWKQNKTFADLKEWVSAFTGALDQTAIDKATQNQFDIVIAPSFPLITPLKMILQSYPYIKIAAQDISKFDKGAHTGEVGAFQVAEMARFAIIGHSERRKAGETSEDVNMKVKNSLTNGINPVLCFSTEEELFAVEEKRIADFAYEPANAISTAENSSGPISANEVKTMVEKVGLRSVIYGGSVDQNTVENYLNLPFIHGFLVGGASLDPLSFAQIVNKSANS